MGKSLVRDAMLWAKQIPTVLSARATALFALFVEEWATFMGKDLRPN